MLHRMISRRLLRNWPESIIRLESGRPNAKQRFQEINEANEVLGDPEKRKKYDQYGENWKHADEFEAQKQRYQQQGGGGFGGGGASLVLGRRVLRYGRRRRISDFFESLFGSRRGGGRSAGFRGQDYNAELHLSFHDAAQTHKQVLAVNGKNIRITVPARWVADGQTIKLKGQGGPGCKRRACRRLIYHIRHCRRPGIQAFG